MTTTTLEKPVSELSTKELEAILANKKALEKRKRENERKAYEKEKDETIESLFYEAVEIALTTARFKEKCHVVMQTQHDKLSTYGGIRSNSKGGFELSHSDGNKSIRRRRDTDPKWDERATKAVELIKDFLGDTVKKRDADLHDILMDFIERNEAGDLEFAKVMNLFKHQEKFNDPRWVNGLQLIKESYSQSFKAYSYEFKQKGRTGKMETLQLNFSSL